MTRRGGGREDAAAVWKATGARTDLAGAPSRAGTHVSVLHLCLEQPAPGQGNLWICKKQCKASRESEEEKNTTGFLGQAFGHSP